MTEEEKQLLLIELCTRLPYGVIVQFEGWNPEKLSEVDLNTNVYNGMGGLPIPYLRPMSSMTEEEKDEYDRLVMCNASWVVDDWLNKNQFDYRGLIPMGLALEAKEGMYMSYSEKHPTTEDIIKKRDESIQKYGHFFKIKI